MPMNPGMENKISKSDLWIKEGKRRDSIHFPFTQTSEQHKDFLLNPLQVLPSFTKLSANPIKILQHYEYF